jgi:hypothetical protein
VGSRDFFLLYRLQPESGAHPASYLMDTEGSFPVYGVKLTAHFTSLLGVVIN